MAKNHVETKNVPKVTHFLHLLLTLEQCFSTTVSLHTSVMLYNVRCTAKNDPISVNWSKKKITFHCGE